MDSDEEQALYLTIGFLVTNWGLIESTAAVATNALYLNVSLPDRPKRMPLYLRNSQKFIRRALLALPELAAMRDEGIALLDRTAHERDLREHFVHSALTGYDASRGAYSFTQLDAKDQEHKATDWEFDARSFPALHDRLSKLVVGWHKFALEVTHFAEGVQAKRS